MGRVPEKSTFDFFTDQVLGSRAAIRLFNSACGWIEEVTGKTHFTFLGCELDTAAISENWLKPLDNEIYIIKGTAALFALPEKCWYKVNRNDVGTVLRAVQHLLKTIGDSAAGMRCLAVFGFVYLNPYLRTLNIVKYSFTVGAGLMEISCRVHNIWKASRVRVKTDAERRDKDLRSLADVLMIAVQIFSIQLNFFGGCYPVLHGGTKPRIPGVIFNFWGTNASLAALGYSAVEYIRTS